jgi:hypothetical protein
MRQYLQNRNEIQFENTSERNGILDKIFEKNNLMSRILRLVTKMSNVKNGKYSAYNPDEESVSV